MTENPPIGSQVEVKDLLDGCVVENAFQPGMRLKQFPPKTGVVVGYPPETSRPHNCPCCLCAPVPNGLANHVTVVLNSDYGWYKAGDDVNVALADIIRVVPESAA